MPATASVPATTQAATTQASVPANALVVAASILQVNDRFVTVEDVLAGVAGELAGIAPNLPNSVFRRRAMEVISDEVRRQVAGAMVLGPAEKQLTEEQRKQIDEEVERTVQKLIADAGGSKTHVEQNFTKAGTSLAAAREGFRRDLIVQTYLREKLQGQIDITRQMLLDAYQANKGKYTQGRQVSMQLIAEPFGAFMQDGGAGADEQANAHARTLARQQIDEAVQALAADEDFAAVAKRLSKDPKADEGGLWPMMSAGSFKIDAVEAAAFSLEEGKVSGVIETVSGFYIVKAAKVDPGRVIPFEEAQDQIRRDLYAGEYARVRDQYFDELTSKATIVRSDQFIETVVDCAMRKYRP